MPTWSGNSDSRKSDVMKDPLRETDGVKVGKRQRVLLTKLFPPAVELRAARDFDAILNPQDRKYGNTLPAAAAGCDALMVSGGDVLSRSIVDALPKSVRIIASFSAGFENFDLDALRERGIVVTNAPDHLSEATADITMLLLLAAARRAHEGQALVREGRWPAIGGPTTLLLGQEICGRRLGILGMGRIGRAVARRARGFGLQVHYHNRRRLSAAQEAGAIYCEHADDLLRVSDFFVINAPLNDMTRHFLDARRIALLPDGAVVVNAGRGGIVHDPSLIAALRSGKVFAAGLDVFEGEPQVNPEYFGLTNVFMLPHLGSATVATRNAMGFCALDNLDAYFSGRPVLNPLI